MKKIIITISAILITCSSYAQNSPFSIWGPGLDGSLYQQSAIYADPNNGLLLEAPLNASGVKLPISFNWRGGGTPPFIINFQGNVGMGIAYPLNKLHIYSTTSADGIAIDGNNNPAVVLRSNGVIKGYASGVVTNNGAFFNDALIGDMVYRSESNKILFGVGNSSNSTMSISGDNVGIGTTNTYGYKLAVNGSAIATSMKVALYGSWPDYVLKPSYRLPSLLTVKAYIDKNQHLPEMPSEQEVKDNGINLGEIVKIQTKKIEELTLYLIEKDKQLSDQQQNIKSQQAQIDELREQLKSIAKFHSRIGQRR